MIQYDIVCSLLPSDLIFLHHRQTMHLMYYTDAAGKRVYTLRKETPTGEITYSAHPGKKDDHRWKEKGKGECGDGEDGLC